MEDTDSFLIIFKNYGRVNGHEEHPPQEESEKSLSTVAMVVPIQRRRRLTTKSNQSSVHTVGLRVYRFNATFLLTLWISRLARSNCSSKTGRNAYRKSFSPFACASNAMPAETPGTNSRNPLKLFPASASTHYVIRLELIASIAAFSSSLIGAYR